MARVADIGRGQEGTVQEWSAPNTVLALCNPFNVTRQGTEMCPGGLHVTSPNRSMSSTMHTSVLPWQLKGTPSQGLTCVVRDEILS